MALAPFVPLAAQNAPLSSADSQLVAAVLLAENRRDSSASSFRSALAHADPRVQLLARRALGRIRDPLFASRDALPPVAPAPTWPEPAWRLRYRALAITSPCTPLEAALADSAWPVRLRAADLSTRCAAHAPLVAQLNRWVDSLPRNTARRVAGGVSWHPGAHALVALASLDAPAARRAVTRHRAHGEPAVRQAVARAARVLADSTTLRRLAADKDPNVQETAIDLLSALAGHGADDAYLAALATPHAQAARAAAVALKGSTNPAAAAAARRALAVWTQAGNASARDVRVALLEVLGQPAAADQPPPNRYDLPPDAVRLALGADVRLRVSLAAESGGGSFVVRLRGDLAPIMAAEILALVHQHYYDGLTWHRVEHDFVIQGGSPGANEYVGFARYLRDELATLPHPRGTVGMSTRGHDTGDAQWFVNLKDNARLLRDYTIFAEVVDGIEVVDGVLEGDRISRITVEPR